jgi:multidrug efflux pump subunit AcrA (membrane-fusion protein)
MASDQLPTTTVSPTSPSDWTRWMRMPLVVLPVLVILIAAFAGWWFGIRSDGTSTAAATVTTTKQLVTVTSGPTSQTVSADGTVAAAQTDDLSFTAAGTVTAVNVKAGASVTKGQVLATIDSAALQSALTSAESTLADAKAKLSNDETAGASSDQIAADNASITTATDSVTNAYVALQGAQLVATFNGTVASVDLTVGEQLSSSGTGGTSASGSKSGFGQSAGSGSSSSGSSGFGASSSSSSSTSSVGQIAVVSQGQYSVAVDVTSSDVGSVQVGQAATLTLSSAAATNTRANRFAQLFGGGTGPATGGTGTGGAGTGGTGTTASTATANGTVTAVSKVATVTSGVASYPVTVAFNAASNDFYVGSTVTAVITTGTQQNVIQVSSLAVTTSNGVSTVVVATGGTVNGPTATRTVTTGATSNGEVTILSGLKVGEKIVVSLPSFGGRTFGGGGGFGGGSGTGAGARTGTGAGQ